MPNSSEHKMVRGTMIAFDKSSGATYSNNLVASTKEEANNQFEVFKQNVSFVNWYYEIQVEVFDLTPTQSVVLMAAILRQNEFPKWRVLKCSEDKSLPIKLMFSSKEHNS